jgi:hypothetical protein
MIKDSYNPNQCIHNTKVISSKCKATSIFKLLNTIHQIFHKVQQFKLKLILLEMIIR